MELPWRTKASECGEIEFRKWQERELETTSTRRQRVLSAFRRFCFPSRASLSARSTTLSDVVESSCPFGPHRALNRPPALLQISARTAALPSPKPRHMYTFRTWTLAPDNPNRSLTAAGSLETLELVLLLHEVYLKWELSAGAVCRGKQCEPLLEISAAPGPRKANCERSSACVRSPSRQTRNAR